MWVYPCILWGLSVVLGIVGLRIFRGKTDLIHDYHQSKVRETDKQAYGKAFAKAFLMIPATMTVSGILGCWGTFMPCRVASMVVFFLGLVSSLIAMGVVQKKYNGGWF